MKKDEVVGKMKEDWSLRYHGTYWFLKNPVKRETIKVETELVDCNADDLWWEAT